jgi:hypothetical protein
MVLPASRRRPERYVISDSIKMNEIMLPHIDAISAILA